MTAWDIAFTILFGATALLIYGAVGITVALCIDEYTNADEFDVAVCGMAWPITLAFWLFIGWPYKIVAFFYRGIRSKIKKAKKSKKVKSKPVEVK